MAHRRFVDAGQAEWTVWEIHCPEATRRSRMQCGLPCEWLAFQRRGERRRLSPVPHGWEALSAAELERLCELADVTPYHL